MAISIYFEATSISTALNSGTQSCFIYCKPTFKIINILERKFNETLKRRNKFTMHINKKHSHV